MARLEIEPFIIPGIIAGGLIAAVVFKDQLADIISKITDLIPSGGGGDGNGDGGNGDGNGDGDGGGGGSGTCVKKTCQSGYTWSQSDCKCIKKSTTPPPPTPTTGWSTDSNGIKIPYKMTGKKVKLNVGGRHENGDRYNANHSFKNYYVVAYYKTSSGQELLEMKTDGPNHSGCSSLPKCMWAEPAFELKGGKSHISSEYPHPKNHPAVTKGFQFKTIPGNWGGKTIGYGVAAYYNSAGYRVYDQWIDTGGNKWVRTIHGANTGQLMPQPKRALPTGGKGLEAEIRCHGGHGTSMSKGNIYEIVPPKTANLAYAYNADAYYERITLA